MSDQLVHVRDKSTGEEGYVGAAWLDRWPDDFTVIDPSQPAPAPAPAATPAPAAAPVDEARPAPTTTQF